MSFSQHGPRAVCILSANGAISNVTLRQQATSGGTVTYEVGDIAKLQFKFPTNRNCPRINNSSFFFFFKILRKVKLKFNDTVICECIGTLMFSFKVII
jgi:hypothetical protein